MRDEEDGVDAAGERTGRHVVADGELPRDVRVVGVDAPHDEEQDEHGQQGDPGAVLELRDEDDH